jgi:large subunit ribosomal protein L25
VVLKGIQRDDITQAVTHLTVQQVRDEDKVRVSIPLVFEGTPLVVTKGDATIVTNMNKLEVEGVVKNLPSILKIQIGHMASNERILVGDLELPEGVSALAPAAAPVVSTAGRRR